MMVSFLDILLDFDRLTPNLFDIKAINKYSSIERSLFIQPSCAVILFKRCHYNVSFFLGGGLQVKFTSQSGDGSSLREIFKFRRDICISLPHYNC